MPPQPTRSMRRCLLKELATAKFNETVEVAVNLGVDARKSDQAVRGATTLPHGTGSEVRVAVFTQGENAEKAKAAGADFVGMEELAEQVKGGMMDFRRGRRLSRCHARRGPARPDPRPARPDAQPEDRHRDARRRNAVKNAKAGQMRFRTDKNGIIHGGIGKIDFEPTRSRATSKLFWQTSRRPSLPLPRAFTFRR
jgi:large subunit ribosomal protein L1